jgi:hypothetical protein
MKQLYGLVRRPRGVFYPERFAQQALGHNSKAVHHAYAKHAEVTVPSLDDWERQWKENPQGMQKPELVSVDFQECRTSVAEVNRVLAGG